MSNKNVGKPLTIDLVFTKTKSDSLENIKNLNLWGNDLEDLQIIDKMPNLEVVSLSVNRIRSLKDFMVCSNLQQLYLRKNNIADIREIRYLVKLPALRVLWLHDNPCAQIENYREIVIKYLPNLVKLDNHPVTPEDKLNSQRINFQLGKLPQAEQTQNSNESKYAGYKDQKNQISLGAHSNQSNTHKPPQRKQNYQVAQNSRAIKNQTHLNKENYYGVKAEDINRNQNILMAVLSLMRELDQGSLEIVRRETDKLLE